MAGQKSNLRNLTVTTGSGTDVKSTQQLKGEAKESGAFKETNVTKEYVAPGGNKAGPLGGENSGS